MSTTTVPSLQKQSNLFIVRSNGLMLKCDKCKSAIKDYICFCSKCKKCLDLTCAGFRINGEYISSIRGGEKHTDYCLESIICDVATNNNAIRPSAVSVLGRPNQFPHKLLRGRYGDYLLRKTMPEHKLGLTPNGTVYRCFGCKEQGFGPHVACQNASCFRLHKTCSYPRKFMTHPFFPGLSFAFSSEPKITYFSRTVNCNACGMGVNGYLYEDSGRKKHLHPCCANLPRQIICGESGATMVLQKNTTLSCYYCDEKTVKVGHKKTDEIWSYVSVSRRDNIHLHVPCIMKMLSDLQLVHLMDSGVIGRVFNMLIAFMINTEVNYSMTKLEFQITAATDVKKKWEKKFTKKFMKYAKIALGAIIAAFFGDPTTFIFNCSVTIIPN